MHSRILKRAALSAAKLNVCALRSNWQTSMTGDEGRRLLGELSSQLEKDVAVFSLSPLFEEDAVRRPSFLLKRYLMCNARNVSAAFPSSIIKALVCKIMDECSRPFGKHLQFLLAFLKLHIFFHLHP